MRKASNRKVVKQAISEARDGTTSVWIAKENEQVGAETAIDNYDQGWNEWTVSRQWYEPADCLCLVVKYTIK